VCTLPLLLIHEVLLDDDVAAEASADEARCVLGRKLCDRGTTLSQQDRRTMHSETGLQQCVLQAADQAAVKLDNVSMGGRLE